jgi:hypothetical protein
MLVGRTGPARVRGNDLPANNWTRLWGSLSAAALAAFAPTAPPARADPHALELAIEATYLYRLAHFATWPASAFSGPASPLVICIQGTDPFGAVLDHLVVDRRVGGREIAVKRLARLEAGSGCQIAYVAGGPAQSAAQALDAVDDAPVVTVTDQARAGDEHGIVHLVREGQRLRFSIDNRQADRNGVAISSKVLALATEVKR